MKIGALALFTIMASMIKVAVEYVPAGQAVFFRAFFSLPIIVSWLVIRGEMASGLRTRAPMLHIWRGLIGGSAMGLSFVALGLLPLPEVTVVGFIAPIMVLVLAVFMLGETVRMFRWSMVGLGLLGVIIVVWPRLSIGDANTDRLALIGVSAALIAASLRALVQIHVRRMVKTEQTSAIVFYFAVTVSVGALLTFPFGWDNPPTFIWVMLIGSGLVGGVAQLLITTAFRHADASMLAPFDYVSILFSMLAGYMLFDEAPTGPMLAGAALVILSGVLIIWRERQIGIKARGDRVSVTPQG